MLFPRERVNYFFQLKFLNAILLGLFAYSRGLHNRLRPFPTLDGKNPNVRLLPTRKFALAYFLYTQ